MKRVILTKLVLVLALLLSLVKADDNSTMLPISLLQLNQPVSIDLPVHQIGQWELILTNSTSGQDLYITVQSPPNSPL